MVPMPNRQPEPEEERAAALRAAEHSRDSDDLRVLLQMLGLLR
jgi:hypothetical protein